MDVARVYREDQGSAGDQGAGGGGSWHWELVLAEGTILSTGSTIYLVALRLSADTVALSLSVDTTVISTPGRPVWQTFKIKMLADAPQGQRA